MYNINVPDLKNEDEQKEIFYLSGFIINVPFTGINCDFSKVEIKRKLPDIEIIYEDVSYVRRRRFTKNKRK